jgi:hypothetical protein
LSRRPILNGFTIPTFREDRAANAPVVPTALCFALNGDAYSPAERAQVVIGREKHGVEIAQKCCLPLPARQRAYKIVSPTQSRQPLC